MAQTAASSPPGDIGGPGSGSGGTIHRLCLTPEVRHCGFCQLTKIIADHVGLHDRHFSNSAIGLKKSPKIQIFLRCAQPEYNFNVTTS
jgi:hypothetical protein